jgi:hypothetical protein
MTLRLALFALPPLPVPVAEEATGFSSSASRFSDRLCANFNADSFPRNGDGAGNVSHPRASISYHSHEASRSNTERDRTRIRRPVFNARSTRNGYSLSQVNLSQDFRSHVSALLEQDFLPASSVTAERKA